MSAQLLEGNRRFDHDGRFDVVAHNWNTGRLYGAAALSAVLSPALFHPLDTLKIHAQVGSRLETRRPLFYAGAYVKTYGVRSLYRGFRPVLSASLISSSIRYGCTFQSSFSQSPQSYYSAFFFATMGSLVAALTYSRYDTAVTRLQADSAMPLGYRRHYTGVQDCLNRMRLEEGKWVWSRGLGLGWLRYGIHFTSICCGTPYLINYFGGSSTYSTMTSLFILNFFTSFLTMPLDTAKVYLQSQPMVQPLMPYPKRLFWFLQFLVRWTVEGALRPWKWEPKARAYLLLERYKEPPRPYYYPFSGRKMLKFIRKRGLWYAYNGFWFYFWRNCAATMLPYYIIEKLGKKHSI